MTPYQFINVEWIANQLEAYGYEFDTFEYACLIKRSIRRTLAEKHAAWNEIIETMHDEEIEVDGITVRLHDHLCRLNYLFLTITHVLPACYDDSVYLLERAVPRAYAILETNKRLVEIADVIVSGVKYDFGGAYKACVYARVKKKEIIDVFNDKSYRD